MRWPLRAAAAGAALLMATGPAGALDRNQQFRTLGVGAVPCSRYTEVRAADSPNAWAAFAVWAAGFLTAHNLLSRDTYDYLGPTTPEQLMASLDGYCAEMPQQPFVFALLRYIGEELAPRRLQRRPTPPPDAPLPATPPSP